MGDSQALDSNLWSRLTPDLVREIASHLHTNDTACGLKLVNSATAAALRERYSTVALGVTQEAWLEPHRAQQPWPGHAFVRHWGRPEPWRALTLRQRRRLLCLAASSGPAPSLEAALAQCGCIIEPEVLAAAAAAGNLEGCERLLREGCKPETSAVKSAARSGSMPTLQLLFGAQASAGGAAGAADLQSLISAAGLGACAGGHRHVLSWLQQAHGYSPDSTHDFGAAAAAGQVALLEELLPVLAATEDFISNRGVRVQLLAFVCEGCPLEVLQRHHDALLVQGQLAAGAGEEAGAGAGAGAPAQQATGDGGGGPLPDAAGAAAGFMAAGVRLVDQRSHFLMSLLEAAAGSGTPCWAAKIDFLLSRWGAAAAAGVWQDRHYRLRVCCSAARHANYLQRLQHLHAVGMPLNANPNEVGMAAQRHETAASIAACNGRIDALEFLARDCGLDPVAAFRFCAGAHGLGVIPAHLSVWRKVIELGYTPTVWDMCELLSKTTFPQLSMRCRRAGEETLLWLAEVVPNAEDPEEREQEEGLWSLALTNAARSGAGLALLGALRARGADVDLAAVAEGGSVEGCEWAAAELLEEAGAAAAASAGGGGGGCGGGDRGVGGGLLQLQARLTPAEVRRIEEAGNTATLAWLRARGLLPTTVGGGGGNKE